MDDDEKRGLSGYGQNTKRNSQANPTPDAGYEEEAPILVEEVRKAPVVEVPLAKELHAYPLARIIVGTFAASIGASFLYLFYSHNFEKGLELFKTVSAVLSGPLGFVLGYYFRVTETGS